MRRRLHPLWCEHHARLVGHRLLRAVVPKELDKRHNDEILGLFFSGDLHAKEQKYYDSLFDTFKFFSSFVYEHTLM